MATEQPAAAPPNIAPPGVGDNVLDWLVTNYLGAKIQGQHILNYNGANLAENHARNTAKMLGLNPASITPFPSPVSVSLQQDAPAKTPAWKQLAFGAALVASGAGAIPAASLLIDKFTEETPVTAPVEPTDPETGNVGFEIR